MGHPYRKTGIISLELEIAWKTGANPKVAAQARPRNGSEKSWTLCVLKLEAPKCNASQKWKLACQLLPARLVPELCRPGALFCSDPPKRSPSRLSLQFAIPGPGLLRYTRSTTPPPIPFHILNPPSRPIPSPLMLRTSLRSVRALGSRPSAAVAGRQWQATVVRRAAVSGQV